MKLGFIGVGNMASAIIKGILAKNNINSSDIFVYDVSQTALQNAVTQYGVSPCKSENDVVINSDAIILAVKPNVLASVLKSINPQNKLLISIAAGKPIEFIEKNLKTKTKIIRVMPNINAVVGQAISAYCFNDMIDENDKKFVEDILNSIGKFVELDENYFPLFGVLGGCSPAFVYMFIDELARVAVQNGMKKDIALQIAAQAVLGSAKMILESDEHPYKLIDKVCSPGGTTIEGIISLQNDGLPTAIHNAVNKAIQKDKLL